MYSAPSLGVCPMVCLSVIAYTRATGWPDLAGLEWDQDRLSLLHMLLTVQQPGVGLFTMACGQASRRMRGSLGSDPVHHHFCCILLAKTSHKGSPDSRRGENRGHLLLGGPSNSYYKGCGHGKATDRIIHVISPQPPSRKKVHQLPPLTAICGPRVRTRSALLSF